MPIVIAPCVFIPLINSPDIPKLILSIFLLAINSAALMLASISSINFSLFEIEPFFNPFVCERPIPINFTDSLIESISTIVHFISDDPISIPDSKIFSLRLVLIIFYPV